MNTTCFLNGLLVKIEPVPLRITGNTNLIKFLIIGAVIHYAIFSYPKPIVLSDFIMLVRMLF